MIFQMSFHGLYPSRELSYYVHYVVLNMASVNVLTTIMYVNLLT